MAQFGGEGSVEVEASIDRCFEVAADVAAYPDWHPVIESVEVLDIDADGRPSRARMVVDASVSKVTVEAAFTYSPPGRVECQRRSGDLKEMWTRFAFATLGEDRTRLDYSTGLDPGRMLSMMARGPVLEKVRGKLVEDAMAGFKAAAESG
jgi:ribosome-associated toxin RatA of RatAB toxin-antitoxin module